MTTPEKQDMSEPFDRDTIARVGEAYGLNEDEARAYLLGGIDCNPVLDRILEHFSGTDVTTEDQSTFSHTVLGDEDDNT